jgi:DNA adenine methylase
MRQLLLDLDNGNYRPPLKWAGGKRWLVPHLKSIWQSHSKRRLVEPLCGGLAVTLGLLPNAALLNDINEHLINFYNWLKRGLVIDFELINKEDIFYANRKRFNQLITSGKQNSKESAGLFYYLNRTAYNGLCRFNRSNEFNVPFGKYKQINYKSDFRDYKKVFSNWTFTNTTYNKVPLEKDDFVYADPPYDVNFTQYSKDGFGWDDQVSLAEWLAKHKGPVVMSNQATERIVNLYSKLGFELKYLQAPRMINCTGDRTPAREVLALRGISK